MFTLTLLLQGGMALNAFDAGLVFSPMGVLFSVSALSGRRLMARHGLRVVVLGSLVVAAGLGVLVVGLATAGSDLGVGWIAVALAIVGVGNGLVLPALIGAALVNVRPSQAGAASGIVVTAQQFAGSTGVAAVGAVFFSVAHGHGGTTGYVPAMEWSAAIDVGLALVVTAMVGVIRSIAAQPDRAPMSPTRAHRQARATEA
jgi:MFS family permease